MPLSDFTFGYMSLLAGSYLGDPIALHSFDVTSTFCEPTVHLTVVVIDQLMAGTSVGNPANRAGLATMMRNIIEKLDNIIITELRELWVLPTEDVPDRRKLNVIVVFCDLPTGCTRAVRLWLQSPEEIDPALLRSLENSVEFAAKSLAHATLPDDRIVIQFVQVGFSCRHSEALKDVVENDDVNLANFTTHMGSMDDQRLWKILLGGVLQLLVDFLTHPDLKVTLLQ
ncbi:hypothetical protein B0H13DRAFT_1911623 [Mycena leptocephala]|nr:hypothetical protein B0H13DRAFT_1911623 [Mycena leptocephala]